MSWLDTLEAMRNKDFGSLEPKKRDQAARDVVNTCSYACAVVAVSPIPFSDVVLMLPIQTAMVMTIGHVYGRKITKAEATDLLLEVGATAGIGMLARQGIKALIPVFGPLLTIAPAFAANWAIGRVAMEYFKNPGQVSGEHLKEVYERAKAEGSSLFSKASFDKFRSKGDVKGAAKKAPAAKKPPVAKKAPVAKAAPKSKVARVVEDDFAARLKGHPKVVKAIGAKIHLDITGEGGGQWTVDCKKSSDWISPELVGEPKLKLSASVESFLGLIAGTTNAQVAVLSGALVLEPMDLELAQELGKLFG